MKTIFTMVCPLLLITGFVSCGILKMKPLSKNADSYNCHGDPDNRGTIYSPLEEKLIRQGALKSRKINMESGIGMMEKSARLFVLDKNEIRIVFHLMHPIDLEIKKFGFAVQGDAGQLVSGEMQVDYRATIGGMSEEQAYIIYPADKLTHLLEDQHVSIEIDDMSFNLPFECRESFREIRDKIGTR